MLIVGAGAGGATLAQRLARRGWRVLVLEAGPFWDPDEDWVSDEAGAHELYWTEARSHRRGGPGRARQEQLRPRRRRLDDPLRRVHPALSPLRLRGLHPRRRGRRLADLLPGPQAALRAARARAARRRRVLAVGRPARLPARPASRRRRRAERVGGRQAPRDRDARRPGRDRQRQLRASAALHLPRLLPAGLQGGRQGVAARHPRPRRAGARCRDPRRLHGHEDRDQRDRQRAPASPTSTTGRSASRPPTRSPSPATRSRRRGCCCTPRARASPTAWPTRTTSSAAGSWFRAPRRSRAASPRRCGCTRRRRRRSAPSSSTRPTPARGFARGFSIQTVGPLPIGWAEHVLADGHWGQALREYMRDYNHWYTIGCLSELLPQGREPRHARR